MKKIKMVIYGEPGVGKSVFASKSPKPFFITTDGNYDWLEDFGAKEKDHIQVYSWAEAKKVFERPFDEYETIVVDLTEDLFKWCEFEFCQKNRCDHVSDLGYGKGYDITRNEFFIEISKLLAKDKNVILIMHGYSTTVKDRRGVEKTHHYPTNRLPDKVIDMIEGRVRYFLRCYLKGEDDGKGKITKKRYLSLVPKENEFGILRGVYEQKLPEDIPLEWTEFIKAINLQSKEESIKTNNKIEDTLVLKKSNDDIKIDSKLDEVNVKSKENEQQNIIESTVTSKESNDIINSKINTEIKEEKMEEVKKEEHILSNDEKIALIKQKLASMKLNRGE